MSFKIILQFILGLSLILFAAVVTWYEGSEIIDNPWEWKYSAPFSNMLNGEINGKQDISQLDYFIYAMKFKPVFPTVLLLSSLYFFILSGYLFLKRSLNKFCYFLRIIGALLIFLSTFLSNSPSMGAEVIRNTLLSCSASLIGISFIIYFLAVRKTTI
ncbi:YjdJ family protein [Neobacillus pocheonensis]|uniref:YjdJ family protein n=1 Tax=Neobacillus pocheonensis TaxID=363869 RepID=UPI003D290B6B